ncbi:hypothetical protein Tco_0679916 [Tanacetum coccineum]|uniref:Uncharacterized protein n=1 Tax=Tanacetum coccineum TaxID=301880 RepID=A0ABQ4XKL8_9ASTR
MSDSEHSIVTYTSISSDDGSSDVGSLGVIVLGYDGLSMMPKDPYAYVETAMQEPPPLDFVPKPAYPEFMPPEDYVFLAEEQPLPAAVSPTADLPGYITKSDPEKDPEEEDDEDPEEDPTDYPTDRDDDDEEESSINDVDDEEEDEGKDEGEEEEHLAPADFIPSPPLPVSSPLPISPPPLPISPTHSLGYRPAMIWLRAESPSTSHLLPLPPPIVLPRTKASMAMMRAAAPSTYYLAPPSGTPPLLPIPLPTSPPPLLLPSTDCRADVPEVMLPPLVLLPVLDYGFVATLDAEIRRDLDREIGYGITDVWEDPDEIAEEIAATDVAEFGQRMTDFVTTIREDTDEIYVRFHARTARLRKGEARVAREAWAQSIDASDTARSETQMVALQSQQRPARDPAHPDVPEEAGCSS